MSLTSEQYENKIKELEREIEELKKKQTVQMKRQQYGLTWIDVPEAFDKESENKIPVLEEVKDKAISNDDGKPTHILIEGDNYHALQCLNYTHKGKVDVIYIDPPYNTGSDGFIYKDARYLKEYPDGTELPVNHPLRHSSWINYINKRLVLSKNLLSETGLIFISIDDNEVSNLTLLCNQVFGIENFIAKLIWKSKSGGANDSKFFAIDHEYILVYAKNFEMVKLNLDTEANVTTSYNMKDEYGEYSLDRLDKQSLGYLESLDFPIVGPDGKTYIVEHKNPAVKVARWRWGKETVKERYNELVFKNGYVYTKNYRKDGAIPRSLLTEERFGRTRTGKTDCIEIFGKEIFSNPKPVKLIEYILNISAKQNSIFLDFFAGSGTSLQAVLQKENKKNLQCILVQQKEPTWIMKDGIKTGKKGLKTAFESGYEYISDITYERNKRVIQGYTNSKGEQVPGLGNSLKYYKTAFVGNHDASNATDDDCVTLAKKAGCLLSIGENTLDEIQSTNFFQIYEDKNSKLSTAIYFTEELSHFDEFVESVKKVASNHKTVIVYTFSWSSSEDFIYEFEGIPNVEIKAIPQPILEIYKSIYQK